MPMNDEVRKALDRVQIICDTESEWADIPIADWHTLNNELTRLTEIADSVDPLVVRLGEVTTRLEAADAMLREAVEWNWLEDGWPAEMEALDERITAHLSENGHG